MDTPRRRPRALAAAEAATNVAGLVMLLAPLALWVVPTVAGFKAVLLVIGIAWATIIQLADYLEAHEEARRPGRGPAGSL